MSTGIKSQGSFSRTFAGRTMVEDPLHGERSPVWTR